METARCKAFLAAAEEGSFTKAADRLSYTPSGISQLVTALEQELGVTLLHRTQRGVTPTEIGKTLLPSVRKLLQGESCLYEQAAELNGLLIGSITVAAYSSIATHWLPAVIRNFQHDYPQIEIRLMEGIRQEVVRWLDERRADLGFLSYQEPMHGDWFPLAEDPMLAVLPPEHPLAHERAFPLENCAYDRFIMPALGRDDDVAALFERRGVVPNIQYTTLENFAAMAMVEQGLGVSVMNELITKRRECSAVLLPLDPPASITLGLALPSQKSAPPAVRKFVEYAIRQLTKTETTTV